jgi:hypothetical protein
MELSPILGFWRSMAFLVAIEIFNIVNVAPFLEHNIKLYGDPSNYSYYINYNFYN